MKLHRAANTARETMESIALGFAQMGSMGYSVPAIGVPGPVGRASPSLRLGEDRRGSNSQH